MRSLLKFTSLVLYTIVALQSSAQAPSYTAVTNVFLHDNLNCFWQYLPQDYGVDLTKRYPLIIVMHGVGERSGKPGGSDPSIINKVNTWAPAKFMNDGTFPASLTVGGENFRYIGLCPQVKEGLDYSNPPDNVDSIRPEIIDTLIEYAKDNYRVDSTRIYLVGMSMGGGAVLHYIGSSAEHAQKIAAIAVACPSRTLSTTEASIIGEANIPFLITHCTDDPTVRVERTLQSVAELEAYTPAMSPQPKKIIWATGGHGGGWFYLFQATNGYAKDTLGMTVYNWLLQFQRSFAVLPVRFEEFTANTMNNGVQLQWKTQEDLQTSHYDIESSQNGQSWMTIASVKAIGGGQQSRSYQHLDIRQRSGPTTYYRITAVDADQRRTLSKTLIIKNDIKDQVRIYSGSSAAELQIQLDPEIAAEKPFISLYSPDGRMLIQQQLRSTNTNVSVPIRQTGIYFALLTNGDARLHAQQLWITAK